MKVNNARSGVLEQMADPTRFLSKKGKIEEKEVCLDKQGKLATRIKGSNSLFGVTKQESHEELKKIRNLFLKKINKHLDRAQAGDFNPRELMIMKQNFNIVRNDLMMRAGGQISDKTQKAFKELMKKVDKLNGEDAENKPALTGIVRRIARYGLFKLYMNGGVGAYLSQTFPGAAAMAKDAMKEMGKIGVAAAGFAANAAREAAKEAGPTVKDYLPDAMTFLAVTEGPGLAGYAVRRMTPKSIKRMYNNFMPNIIQKPLAWLCQTPKPIEKALDKSFAFLDAVFN